MLQIEIRRYVNSSLSLLHFFTIIRLKVYFIFILRKVIIIFYALTYDYCITYK
jgi:hypothetical protein